MTSPPGTPPAGHAAARLAAFAWPAALLRALERLRAGGHQAWLVGGVPRDVLLGRSLAGAFDVATDRLPADVASMFPRVEPIGMAHGTVLVLEDDVAIECTTFRREGSYRDARHPDEVVFTRDLREDLARRDLTINAMAFDPHTGAFEDPHQGVADIDARVLRAVGDPRRRFEEDALRPVRVARFASTLGFTPEPATRRALAVPHERAGRVAVERVRAELDLLMAGGKPSSGIELLRESGLLGLWMPELVRCVGVPQNRWHAHDVYVHSLLACDAAPAGKRDVRWAALLHDLGKPETRAGEGEDATFYGHAEAGARLADGLLRRLRAPGDERDAIVHLVREHMFDYRPEWSDGAVRRWLRRVGERAVEDLFELRRADAAGSGIPTAPPPDLDAFAARIRAVLSESRALRVRDLAVDGEDVMRELGIGPGREVGLALEGLLESVLDDPELNRREALLERLRARRDARARKVADA
jgi:putative nucleotidyltransferase with HDIG domain